MDTAGPCSSNGEAAASLAALFAQQGLAPAPPPPQQLPEAGPSEAVEAAPSPDQQQWRLKFLHKVGIPANPRGAHEAPPELGRSPTPASQSGGATEGGGSAEEVVVVRQVAARKSTDDIRLGYIKKLENSRAFIPQLNRPKTSQTVTIFDWDDTLLCTSARRATTASPRAAADEGCPDMSSERALRPCARASAGHLEMVQRQYGAIPSQVREQLASLERIVKTLLQQACQVGKAFIITNASEGWVQHSSTLCMPGLQEDLAKVDIISARGAFEASFPGDSHAWKMHAFLQVQNKLQLEAVTNLVSVGDSHIEMDAVHLLGRSFAHALVKTVKLWERPTPYELQKQLEVVADKLPDIYRAGTTLNIWLERETAQAS